MSKSSGIMKIDSPGKLGPGLNIDQDAIRKQILAAKQVHTHTGYILILLRQRFKRIKFYMKNVQLLNFAYGNVHYCE